MTVDVSGDDKSSCLIRAMHAMADAWGWLGKAGPVAFYPADGVGHQAEEVAWSLYAECGLAGVRGPVTLRSGDMGVTMEVTEKDDGRFVKRDIQWSVNKYEVTSE